MSDVIIVDYDMFNQQSRLYIVKDGQRSECQISSNIATLASKILEVTHETGIYEVKMRAPLSFISEVNRQVKNLEKTTYYQYRISVGGL